MIELSPEERWIRNKLKKAKEIQDQEILDQMMVNLKKKNETEKELKIQNLTKNLEESRG